MNESRAIERRGRTASLPAALLSAIVAVVWPTAVRSAPADESSWSWTPQPVAIAVETAGDPALSPGLVREVREAILLQTQATFGAGWKLRFVDRFETSPQPPASAATRESAEKRPAAPQPAVAATAVVAGEAKEADEIEATDEIDEKQILVTLARRAGDYVVEARETDLALRSTGPIVRRMVRQREQVGEAAAEAVTAAYRPTARIEDIRQDGAALHLRGEPLLPIETRAALCEIGDGFVPMLRRRDRDGRVVSVERVPWTILSIRDAAAGPLKAVISSGMRSPLAGRRRGRVEAVAIAAGKPTGVTALTVTAGTGGAPLPGAAVYDFVAGEASKLLGTTDEHGRITIGADGGRVRTLVISGRYLPLARLPLIGGLDAEASAPLPVDVRLFEAERRLSNLQSEFTDTLVLRRVLAITAATQLERGNKAGAAATILRLGQTGTTTEFADQLEVRRRGLELGPSVSDRLIDRLYSEAVRAMRAVDDRQALAELQKRLTEAK